MTISGPLIRIQKVVAHAKNSIIIILFGDVWCTSRDIISGKVAGMTCEWMQSLNMVG